ncbi:MAG TPA: LytTR family DNA-binding domain-containing protein [Pyrinomonadaceae bacterium]|jgi:two-component system LytT family response regulator
MSETKIRVLIVDDEPLARKYIRRMLEDSADVEVVGESGDGRGAALALRELAPDLVFLDVQMPEADGFAVVEAVGVERMPPVIFVTAYEEYAVRAFEIHALDYLLKPFDRARFERAMGHARVRLRGPRREEEERGQLGALVRHVRARPEHLSRLLVKSAGRIISLKVEVIDWIEADDKYVRLHAGKVSHMVRQTLSAMEAQLDPKAFVRIHRSALVNVERVAELRPTFGGEFHVLLEDGTRLTLSRNYRERLFDRLGRPM